MSLGNLFLLIAMLTLSVTIFFCLIRAVKGPRMTDRLVAVNIISVKGIALILLLGQYLQDNVFLDVALVYTLLSFVAIIALARNMLAKEDGEGRKEDAHELS